MKTFNQGAPIATSIYLPSTGAASWQWLLARPDRHWKHGASAMALAAAWERPRDDPWPPAVAVALDGSDLGALKLLLAMPEHEVPLLGGTAASQTDLFALARHADGLVTMAVEGKVNEPFGDQAVAAWRDGGSKGKEKRLAYLLEVLGLDDNAQVGALRYQLLHRTASALIEAERFGAAHAVMLVHSFSQAHKHFDAYKAFANALGVPAAVGSLARAMTVTKTPLWVGWVSDDVGPAAPHALLTSRFDRALLEAHAFHDSQVRKGTEIPYVSHLLGVVALVLEDGGTEDEAIAALLHDPVEDQGGQPTLKRIEQLFGPRVADIVDACSDTDSIPKPPWHARKQAYVDHLADVDSSALRVSLADKLHNARAIWLDARATGPAVWTRFNANRDDVLWYYQALVGAFAARDAGPMVGELRRTVKAINDLKD